MAVYDTKREIKAKDAKVYTLVIDNLFKYKLVANKPIIMCSAMGTTVYIAKSLEREEGYFIGKDVVWVWEEGTDLLQICNKNQLEKVYG